MDEERRQTGAEEFARQAAEHRASLIGEYLYFVRHHKKWWMLPLIALLLAAGALMMLSSTGAAPFIYTLF